MKRRSANAFTAVLLAAAVIIFLPQLALAQVVQFHARGENAQYNSVSGQYVGGGLSTHFGRHMNQGKVEILGQTAIPGQLSWRTAEPGPGHVITAADGSTISLTGGGLIQLIPLNVASFDPSVGPYSAVWQAAFQVQSGTGRFANVGPGNGPIVVEAINQPFLLTDPIWKFSWTINGTIDLRRKGNQ